MGLCSAEDRPELGLVDLGLGATEHGSRAWADLGLVGAFWADLGQNLDFKMGYNFGSKWALIGLGIGL